MPPTYLLPDRPFTRDEASDFGLTRRRLETALAQGVVRRVLRIVYVAGDVPDSLGLRAQAAALVLPERMVVCDRGAAWLHGVDHREPHELDVPPRLEVVAVEGTRTRLDGTRGGTRTVGADEIMALGGVQVTTPLRTAADLARHRGRLGALAVLDQFARTHGITAADLDRMAGRLARHRGVTQLRALAPLVTPLAESPGESWVRLLILDHGLPAPTPQFIVELPEGSFRLDLAYPHLRVAIEYDGAAHHSAPEDRAHDLARRAALRRAGWTVIVVRKEDLSDPSLGRWLRELRDALEERTGPHTVRFARAEASRSRRRR